MFLGMRRWTRAKGEFLLIKVLQVSVNVLGACFLSGAGEAVKRPGLPASGLFHPLEPGSPGRARSSPAASCDFPSRACRACNRLACSWGARACDAWEVIPRSCRPRRQHGLAMPRKVRTAGPMKGSGKNVLAPVPTPNFFRATCRYGIDETPTGCLEYCLRPLCIAREAGSSTPVPSQKLPAQRILRRI